MRRRRTAVVVLLLAASASSCSGPSRTGDSGTSTGQHEIHGQIFVVTNGRENIKLALVQVGLMTETALDSFVDHRLAAWQGMRDSTKLARDEGELRSARAAVPNVIRHGDTDAIYAAQRRVGRLEAEIDLLRSFQAEYPSVAFVKDGLPVEASAATSDADGKFVLAVSSEDQYWAYATTGRTTLGGVESYTWLVPLAAHDASRPLLLSNQNMLSDATLRAVFERFSK